VKASEWLTIVALILGPILAVQAQKWIELAREKRNQRLYNFNRLMATRGAQLSAAHVEALNMIDPEFSGASKKDENVRLRWKEYLDNLASLSNDPKEQEKQIPAWTQKNQDLLANLLHEMGLAVGYKFDKVQILRGIYSPKGHAQIELENQLIRRFLIELLAGHRTLPLDVRSLPNTISEDQPNVERKPNDDAPRRPT
jgi:hypothetical protein